MRNVLRNVQVLSSEDYVVVDLDSGTVLGTNVVLVRLSDLDQDLVDLSDSETIAIADNNGLFLFTEV